MTRKFQILGWALMWGGVVAFGYLGWQIYGTDLINAGVQAEARSELEAALAEARRDLPEPQKVGASTWHPEPKPEAGDAFAFIRIPKLGVDRVVFEGADDASLTKGPAHMRGTPLPGQPGNSAIAGHRTTHGRPFHDFDLLEAGDVVEVETAVGAHTYTVRKVEIVAPDASWVIDPRPGGWLTLITCEPKYSARLRLVVWAEMTAGPNLGYVNLTAERGDE